MFSSEDEEEDMKVSSPDPISVINDVCPQTDRTENSFNPGGWSSDK